MQIDQGSRPKRDSPPLIQSAPRDPRRVSGPPGCGVRRPSAASTALWNRALPLDAPALRALPKRCRTPLNGVCHRTPYCSARSTARGLVTHRNQDTHLLTTPVVPIISPSFPTRLAHMVLVSKLAINGDFRARYTVNLQFSLAPRGRVVYRSRSSKMGW